MGATEVLKILKIFTIIARADNENTGITLRELLGKHHMLFA